MFWLSICTLLSAVQIVEAGLFSKSQVLKLNGANFRDQVLQNDNVTVVEFYAPWCGHCKDSAPELKKSAKALNGIARVGAVNCDAPENKDLCAHYKIKAYPTIKVFQPAKKTDQDFKLANQGQEAKRKPHRVLDYKGPRDSRSINKYAVSKIRNYAATLDGDLSFVWLKSNGVPRVIMLPGSRYKSKSIAPLFKVLSNEYFGKMRFAYIPRRADGGWNMLGLKAPENSTLVYMSDDKKPYIYKGDLTKSKVMTFLNEQYQLEMSRRNSDDYDILADDDNAAYGLEYVLEDQQEEPIEHIAKEEEDFKENWRVYNYHINSAREKRARASASSAGVKYTPIESTTYDMRFTRPWTLAAAPTPDPDYESTLGEFTKTAKAPVNEEDVGSPDETEETEEAEIDDPEAGNIVELEDYTDTMLDEIVDYELAPEDVVAEGPEAVESWKEEIFGKVERLKAQRAERAKRAEEIAEVRMEQLRKKHAARAAEAASGEEVEATPTQQLPPGITPKPIHKEKAATNEELTEDDYLRDHALRNMDELIMNCIRREKTCIVVSSSRGFIKEDVRVLLRTRLRFDARSIDSMVFQFYIDEADPELEEASKELGLAPYSGTRKNHDGVVAHNPAVAIFDYKKRQYALMESHNGGYNSEDVMMFITQFFRKKKQVNRRALPLKYHYYITEDDIELIDKLGVEMPGDEIDHQDL